MAQVLPIRFQEHLQVSDKYSITMDEISVSRNKLHSLILFISKGGERERVEGREEEGILSSLWPYPNPLPKIFIQNFLVI